MRSNQGKSKAYAMLFGSLMLFGLMAPAFTQVSTPEKGATPNPEVELGRKLYTEFIAFYSIKDLTKREQAIKIFIRQDTEKMPQEWRHVLLHKRLFWDQVDGDWDDMLAVKNLLMSKKRASKTDSLLDADLLYQIYYYYSSCVFYPPKNTVIEGDGATFRTNYWTKHYQSDKESERILQYIVDHFDENYVTVAHARVSLAYTQDAQEKYALARQNYKRFEDIDINKLYALPMLDGNSATTITKEKNLKRGLDDVKDGKELVGTKIVETTARLDTDRARAKKALAELSVKYQNDAKAREAIKTTLDAYADEEARMAKARALIDKVLLERMKNKK